MECDPKGRREDGPPGDGMITFFSVPKPFVGHIGVIQSNALRSWRRALPEGEILLFGDDEGIAEAARSVGAIHVADVEKNEYGTPFIDGIFQEVRSRSSFDTLCYSNCDIIFPPAISSVVSSLGGENYLAVGRRWDLVITEPLDLAREGTFGDLASMGKPNNHWAIDYLIFDKTWQVGMPRFLVGRAGWDNWMIYRARTAGLKVVDLSGSLQVYHQHHDHRHVVQSKGQFYGPESDHNLSLMGPCKFSIYDADFKMRDGRLVENRRHAIQRLLYRMVLKDEAWESGRKGLATMMAIKNKVDALTLGLIGDG